MNKVQHFEITADDINRAKKFYSKVFGWEMKSIPEMNYTMMHTGKTDEKGMINEIGVINGGMMKRTNKIKNPVITISVDNIKKSIKNVLENGGKLIIDKMPVGDMGFTAYIKDSEDNVIGLFQPTRIM
jgi:uncharacterized protein